jgi:hypothetical protein
MPDLWIIRVQGREYGPADLATLREWKADGRVLPANEARRVDADVWTTAAHIPELFEVTPPPVQASPAESKSRGSFVGIVRETLRIYREGFLQFLCLTLLTALPSLCGQLTGAFIEGTSNVNLDLRTLAAGAFTFCMFVLTVVLWPIYVAGIQILSAELAAGHRRTFLSVLNQAVKYWARVAALCLFVYGIFFLLSVFAIGIAIMVLVGSSSLFAIMVALGLLAFQVWLFSRFFVNVLFWQQFAVLENASAFDALRESKYLARSRRDLPWFQRPLWRGAFIVSIWTVFVLAITVGPQWPEVREAFYQMMNTQDPQAVLQKLAVSSQAHQLDWSTFALGIWQRVLEPLLGIAFVVLYLKSTSSHRRDGQNRVSLSQGARSSPSVDRKLPRAVAIGARHLEPADGASIFISEMC